MGGGGMHQDCPDRQMEWALELDAISADFERLEQCPLAGALADWPTRGRGSEGMMTGGEG